ncbi:hypothetical protein PsorP6_003097 [Peronosclerospora sorghi]|uniref:Uncharacterized protein n=1 Tax=Peronosclerospora sorghi TaxID=230839 RepID=A0ACC0VKM9_9STRA|nr:hypothetical protein PsorP6_003097 [Peronosclerospora sorghi]
MHHEWLKAKSHNIDWDKAPIPRKQKQTEVLLGHQSQIMKSNVKESIAREKLRQLIKARGLGTTDRKPRNMWYWIQMTRRYVSVHDAHVTMADAAKDVVVSDQHHLTLESVAHAMIADVEFHLDQGPTPRVPELETKFVSVGVEGQDPAIGQASVIVVERLFATILMTVKLMESDDHQVQTPRLDTDIVRHNKTKPKACGSLPPLLESYRADKVPEHNEGVRCYAMIAATLEPFVDCYLAEILSSVEEANVVLIGVQQGASGDTQKSTEVMVRGQLRSGENVCDAAQELIRFTESISKAELRGILFNCSQPEAICKALNELHADENLQASLCSRRVRLGAYANRLTVIPDNWALAESTSIAIMPLLVYLSGFVATFCLRRLNESMGRAGSFALGAGFIVLLLTLSYYLSPDTALWISPLSSILGMGDSIIMVKSICLTGDLVGTHVESGAFVYGAMSFTDKISNGLAILFIQNTRQQWQDVPQADGAFLRQVYCILPSVAALLGLCTILFMGIQGQDRLPRKVTSAFSSGSDNIETLQAGSGTSPRYGSV